MKKALHYVSQYGFVRGVKRELTSINIDPETHKALKIQAVIQDKGVTEAATEAIQEWVEKSEKPEPKKKETR